MSSIAAGELPILPGRSIRPINIAYMVVANNDTAEIHVDAAAATAAGLPAVVVPGSFVLGQIGVFLERWGGVGQVLRLDVRFRAPVFVGDVLNTGGSITEQTIEQAKFDVWVRRTNGELVATGVAVVLRPLAPIAHAESGL